MSTADVLLAKRGDHDAFAALVGGASDRLYALACIILRDADRAEDATQEALVRAWRELPKLRDADRFEEDFRRLGRLESAGVEIVSESHLTAL